MVPEGKRTVPSVVADHIIPLRDWPDGSEEAWSQENGQGLCISCHGVKT
ncbi:hypothetical protein LCGC14_2728930, partial [marine sediment metagenome]